MAKRFDDSRLRFLVGDVRDRDRLMLAFGGYGEGATQAPVDYVIHAAALKQVPTAERDPLEFMNTNILGTRNVIMAAAERGVRKVMLVSTDKACAPSTLYGGTKFVAERLMIAANEYRGAADRPRMSCVRYGNVAGSRGSVIPLFREQKAAGKPLTITDPRMTRFWMTLDQAVEFVLSSLDMAKGGEIFVPKLRAFNVHDLALTFCPESIDVTGIRPWEKLHECMIAEDEPWTDLDDRFIVGKGTRGGPAYSSNDGRPMTVKELREALADV